ncbi:hypothetical protein OSTOST_21515, partial [Ostertagia ostertagi]
MAPVQSDPLSRRLSLAPSSASYTSQPSPPSPLAKLCLFPGTEGNGAFTQLVCLLLVIVFFIDGRIQWKAYTLIYGMAFVLVLGCILTLLLHYFEVPNKGVLNKVHELLWNAVCCALCAVGCVVLVWDWWQIRAGRHHHHSTLAPRNIGESRWLRRVAIVA